MKVFTQTKRFVFLLAFFMIGLVSSGSGQAAVPFSDISSKHWAYTSINWAYTNKIISGYSNGTFGPKRTLTEAEFLVMLTRYDCSGDPWPKSQPGDRHWAATQYAYAKSKHLPLKGYSDSTIRDKPVTRGQVARIVAAFHGFDLNEYHAVQYMYINQLSSGKTGIKNFADYGADESLNRAEAAVFLHRLAKQGKCEMKGLNTSPSGKDNSKYPLPANFLPEGTVTFPESEGETPPSGGSPAGDSRLQAADIEKRTLIANGIDSTFITLSLKDCYGNPISYDESLSFQASSKSGGMISNEDYYEYEHWPEEPYYSAASSSSYVQTDGPDVTVKVTAPALTTGKNDTISLQATEGTSVNERMACYRTPVTVDLSYVPKAELQVSSSQSKIAANGNSTAYVTAKIVKPGGQIISDYNGQVRFYSAKGALLSASNVSFSNGTASAWVTSLSSSSPVEDTIYAELVQMDSRYQAVNSEIKSAKHSTSILYDPGLSTIEGCARENLEVAFIIDSSGSMKRSDPERLRVSKSRELMQTLNALNNTAVDFNHKGRYLSGPDSSTIVSPYLEYVFQSGGTNIADGMDEAFSRFTAGTRKVAILVTDGKSNKQQVLNQIAEAKRQGITVYTVGLGSKEQLNEALLQQVAQETGGRYFHVEKSSEISTAYQTILNELSCGELYLGCSPSGMVFASPSLRLTEDTFYMDTFIDEGCSEVERVIVRFHAADGDVDYDLIYRGQRYFALKKDRSEIDPLALEDEGTFLAFDKDGNLIGSRTIPIILK
ncbi:VWA domain-containing protein [Domibacillus sp. DTU_2020_1001157_1_SI_ALB_TIR_016]|uniref:S-layer homology domain-containing protein n=1 Tax=Domibacillus sp. DTU_2020_1001157_1_SI_ALB_TIR_016 TaxID=3077789 RepID=UPI0028E36FF5|nr:S-layer homology domain-containing protein [Domibacillus sp. DTU_2020_1001157_1_SI_ALB_TIR_016]WNS82136.1 VWA domain-containing protein [Domibacillus sp. DTU_2020_1001157_1_SI_ALB_TIR_016]